MKGKIILITGANRGIGKETTRALAKKGATIIMACRNLEKAEPVREMIQTESKNPNIEVMKLDLASLKSVRNFTQEFKARYQQLNVLINNAGVFCMKREETEEGFELTTVFFTQELAERLKEKDITVNSLHPGHVDTNMWDLWGPEKKWYQSIINGMIKLFLISAEEGAQTSIYLASSNEVKGITGKYFAKKRIKAASKKCSDIKLQNELWQLSERLTGIIYSR